MKQNNADSFLIKHNPPDLFSLRRHELKENPLRHSFFFKALLIIVFILSLLLIAGGIFVFEREVKVMLIFTGSVYLACCVALGHDMLIDFVGRHSYHHSKNNRNADIH